MMKGRPKIALTMGDPAGIGPELAVKAATDAKLAGKMDIILYGSPDILKAASVKFAKNKSLKIVPAGSLKFNQVIPGQISKECGIEAYNTVIKATKDTLEGKTDAIVTAPVCKASINMTGIQFTGHTELIAGLCKTANFAMMQSSGRLRVAFVTTHIPVSKISRAITRKRVVEVAILLRDAILQEGVKNPLIAIAGLNPHAGENGFMGDEEIKIIIPAMETLRKMGISVKGPYPSDTLFIRRTLSQFDGIVSIYHDQGHIPFKMIAFDKGVNSTLGLPIIRTSVDHGTAFEIAWKGIADTGSLFAALILAARRAKNILQDFRT